MSPQTSRMRLATTEIDSPVADATIVLAAHTTRLLKGRAKFNPPPRGGTRDIARYMHS